MKNTTNLKTFIASLSFVVVSAAFAHSANFKPVGLGGGPGYMWFFNASGGHEISIARSGMTQQCVAVLRSAAANNKQFNVGDYTGHWDSAKQLYVMDSVVNCSSR